MPFYAIDMKHQHLSEHARAVIAARCAKNNFSEAEVAKERRMAINRVRGYFACRGNGLREGPFSPRRLRCEALQKIAYYKLIRNHVRTEAAA